MFKKVKNVNAYVKEDGKCKVVITLEDGNHTWINVELLKYAVNNAKPMPKKENKND